MTDVHAHEVFEVPADTVATYERFGGVDGAAVGALMAAALDGCLPCQEPILERIAGLPVTVAKLVELAGTAVQGLAGGLPPDLVDPDAVGAVSSRAFRSAVAAGLAKGAQGIVDVVSPLTQQSRRVVAEDALELVVGVLTMKKRMGMGGVA